MAFVQANTFMSIKTPLGDDTLLLWTLEGVESISEPFFFKMTLRSETTDIDFSQIIDKDATITIEQTDGSKRYINGIVTRFCQLDSDARLTQYEAEMRPWLWRLTLTNDCRVFQDQSAPEIIEALLSDLGFQDYKLNLKGQFDKRAYCVQYNESAFNFISRLMEEEGIFYFFDHTDSAHTLNIADDQSAFEVVLGPAEVRYDKSATLHFTPDIVESCRVEQHIITGTYAVDDFNFETPAVDLMKSIDASTGDMRHYEYPGRYIYSLPSEGDKRAKLNKEIGEASAKRLLGTTYCRGFLPGHSFTLKGFPRQDANISYVLRQVRHQANLDRYVNQFEAFPADLIYRPLRKANKPLISGTQTAIVVGKKNEEVWTDKYGRVKVQFHWDQLGKNDENSSCWIRVAQGWAGKAWGSIFIPRIGQEVVISFLNGDPDRPLITGSVYNATQTVPYALPDNQTQSTIKSNTSKGGQGSNEIRFEDLKDSEELYIHAQKDMLIKVENDRTHEVLNDETITITKNRTTTIKEGNETLTVSKGDRSITMDEGNETYKVTKGTRDVTVGGDETHTNDGNFTQKVSGDYELNVTGAITIKAGGAITIEAGQSMTLKVGQSLTINAMSVTQKASQSITNDAGVSITSKGGATHTVEGGATLILKGGLVKIN